MISGQLLIDRPAFAGTGKIITAEKFVLVDKGGVRGLWATDKDGNVSLTMKSTVGDIVLYTILSLSLSFLTFTDYL